MDCTHLSLTPGRPIEWRKEKNDHNDYVRQFNSIFQQYQCWACDWDLAWMLGRTLEDIIAFTTNHLPVHFNEHF
jgi:hypothetical protein